MIFKDEAGTIEYLYDANGNQTANLNKGVSWIKYNVLNLPDKVQFSNGVKNEYLYDANGVKHRSGYNFSENSTLIPIGDMDPLKENNELATFQIDYCGNFIYEKTSSSSNPVLKRILTLDGYIETDGNASLSTIGNWKSTYLLKDHLGNTRMSITSDILSNTTSSAYTKSDQIDYYPFGMERSKIELAGTTIYNSGI